MKERVDINGVRDLLKVAPSQWREYVERPSNSEVDWQSLFKDLEFIAERASMLSQYILTRTGVDGCGKKEHHDGVKEANKVLVKIRKALGYSYPKAGTFDF